MRKRAKREEPTGAIGRKLRCRCSSILRAPALAEGKPAGLVSGEPKSLWPRRALERRPWFRRELLGLEVE